MKKLFGAFAALALAISSTPVVAQESQGLRLVDATSEFDRFAMSTTGLADEARVKAFEAQMGSVADGFYLRSRKPDRYDTRVLNALKSYPAERDKILAVAASFDKLFGPARASFEREFGPVRSSQPIYLLDSMGEMDGGTRDLNSGEALIFGADVIAKIHLGKDLTALFHHELFHVYHGAVMDDCDPIWCSLWEEGMATFVASALNPGAGDSALMLDLPAPIRPAVEADRAAAVCAVIALLDSTDEDEYATLFYGNKHLPGMPARMGYYIGYLVASEASKTHSLHELAEMKPEQIRPLVEASLRSMADCPAPTALGERG